MMSRSVVVQDDPRLRRRRTVFLFVGAICVFLAGLLFGAWGEVNFGLESTLENKRLRQTVVDQARRLDSLRQELSNIETRHDIDAAALELVRQQLAGQQEAIAELEKGIQFYRGLMAPGEVADGVSVHSIDLRSDRTNERLQFRVLVQQNSRKHELLTGKLQIFIEGLQNDLTVRYDLSELSEQVPNAEIRLRFKYFQAIDGELRLPEGFVPETVITRTESTKPKRTVAEQEFPWSTQERISHVG